MATATTRSTRDRLLVIDGPQARALVDESSLAGVLSRVLVAYSSGRTDTPARIAAHNGEGLLAVMPSFVPATGMAAKIVSVFPGNRQVSKPSHQGVVALFDEIDGRPLAVIEGRAVTELRTAAVSWLAIERLAPSVSLTLAVIGSGRQARAHLDAGLHRREWSQVRVAARRQESLEAIAADFPAVRIVSTAEEAVQGAQVVICCTDSRDPVVRRDWLNPDALLVSVGSGNEVESTIVSASRLVVEWRGAISSRPPAGAEELQGCDPSAASELGELLDEGQGVQSGDGGLTLFKSTGLAVEDLAVARLIFDVAQAREVGTSLAWS